MPPRPDARTARGRLFAAGALLRALAAALAATGAVVAGAVVLPVNGAAATQVAPAAATRPSGPPACVPAVATWGAAQLASQLLMVLGSFSTTATLAPAAAAGVGGIDLLGQPAAGTGAAVAGDLASLRADAAGGGQAPPFLSTTEEGGAVTRLATVIGAMPSARQLGATQPPATITATTRAQGAAMRSLGFTMDLAPVLDTAPATDTVGDEGTRAFSDTPHQVASDGLAFAQGLEQAGVLPVVKHFPGLGHANADTDTGPATTPPLATLRGDDLVPFEAASSAGLPAVMVGNQRVPGLTGGAPSSLSPAAYRLLRATLGFSGLTMTDALGAKAVSDAGYGEPSAAVQAIAAGADLAMVDARTWAAARSALVQAISSGHVPLAQARAAADHVQAAKGIPTCPAAAMAAAPGGTGYWLADSAGGVASFGSATSQGTMAGAYLNQPVVGIAATPDGKGYWEVAADGGIFAFGDAQFHGSMGGTPLNQPVVGMAAASGGGGYWEVAADGGIFSFGDAQFHGSMGGKPLDQPVVGMAAASGGGGYWEVAADGGIFSFGDAQFHGSGA